MRQASTPRRSRRALALWITLGAVLLVVIVFVVVAAVTASRPSQGNTFPNDPNNFHDDGSAALAAVIDDNGIKVSVVGGLADLSVTAKPRSNTTVVVTNSSVMQPATAAAFAERVRDAGRIVLIDPGTSVIRALDLPVSPGALIPTGNYTARAACSVPGIDPTDTATIGPRGYLLDPYAAGTSCFTSGSAAGVVVTAATADRPEVVLMSGSMTSNAHLDEIDNAGISIRLIASTDRVLWYVPKISDQVPQSSSEQSVLPQIIVPMAVLGLFIVAALAIWRGRRFGPLATEPLPAVVKAIETTQSRGRLYRRAANADRAAAILRIRATGRLADYLGLPYDPGRALEVLDVPGVEIGSSSPPEPALGTIVTAVADATGRSIDEVGALLAGPLPANDAELVRYTTDLTDLEKEVRRTP